MERVRILGAKDVAEIIRRFAFDIVNKNGIDGLVIIGIRTRGEYLAKRLVTEIKKAEGTDVPLGVLDITFHRDDLGINDDLPEIKQTDLPFDVTGKTVILVDDVLFSGRTVRAAVETVMDYGRPKRIQMVALIDRGHRDLPVCADYVGKKLETSRNEKVKVSLVETDSEDCVEILK